jgi:hypothetical protein
MLLIGDTMAMKDGDGPEGKPGTVAFKLRNFSPPKEMRFKGLLPDYTPPLEEKLGSFFGRRQGFVLTHFDKEEHSVHLVYKCKCTWGNLDGLMRFYRMLHPRTGLSSAEPGVTRAFLDVTVEESPHYITVSSKDYVSSVIIPVDGFVGHGSDLPMELTSLLNNPEDGVGTSGAGDYF